MVTLDAISTTVGGTTLFKDVSISFETKTGLYGPNGVGKTTLLKIIMGLIPPDTGTVWHNGQTMDNIAPAQRPFSLVFQDFGLWEHLSVWENLYWVNSNTDIYTKYLQQFGLESTEKRRVATLSSGQKQKLAIIRALLKPEWEWLLLDEPTSHLDSESSDTFYELVEDYPYVLVSQDYSVLQRYCTHIYQLEHGRITQNR